MPKTLIDVNGNIDRFLTEAAECAAKELGFAALLTTFPVILSVSETIYKQNNPNRQHDKICDKILFENFIPTLIDKTWLVTRSPAITLSDQDIINDMLQIRNALTHQLSLTHNVGMVNSRTYAQSFFDDHPLIEHIICVQEFVEAVKVTIAMHITNYPDAIFDKYPKKADPRAPANRISGISSSGSAVPDK